MAVMVFGLPDERAPYHRKNLCQSIVQIPVLGKYTTTTTFNERQKLLFNKLLDGFEGKLTSSKWAKIAKCSPETALRNIQDLMNKKVLRKEVGGGRSTSYVLDV